ncbi:MAG: RNA polymerase sigma factor [Cyanobium sp.]
MNHADHFHNVMQRLSPRVYTLARYALANASDAEDLTQDVFTRLWRHWSSIDPDRVEGWLVRATANACVDFKRRRSTRLARESATPAAPPARDPADPLLASETQALVARAIAQLPEPARSLIILREIEGCSYEEVARLLDIPPARVGVALHRARARLATLLPPSLNTSTESTSPREGALHVS